MVVVNVFWTRPQSYYDDAPWRGRWDMDGGAFMNQASHYVDMVDWLVGPVDSVHAYTATLAQRHRGRGLRRHEPAPARRRHGVINVTMLTHGKNFEGSLTLLGEKGTVRVGGVAVNRIEHWEFRRQPAGGRRHCRRQLRPAFGLRPRPPAVLRQRDRHAARRGAGRRSTATRACARWR
jgi:predicted dehydrogenase